MPLDISEYDNLVRDTREAPIQTGLEPARAVQQVAISGVAAQSAVFGDTTKLIRVHTDVPCRILFGENPTASATSPRMSAGATEYFGVRPGHRLSVISTT
jgi:hypothetical protein